MTMTATFTNLVPPARKPERLSTGFDEVDYAAGGDGFVRGTTNLVFGSPGAGKSTLLLQIAASVSRSAEVVYATSEESTEQIQFRAARLRVQDAPVKLIATESIGELIASLRGLTRPPALMIVDSIQSMVDLTIAGQRGSPTQGKKVLGTLRDFAHRHGTIVLVICHVTKSGRLAGPRTLEHDVDATFEIEAFQHIRSIRPRKNRYGALERVGLLEMTGKGMVKMR